MPDRKEYIERGALEEKLDRRLKELRKKYGYFDHYTDGFDEAVDAVSDEPAADVAEVVRCRECKYITAVEGGLPLCTLHNTAVAYNDFCSCGAKMDGKEQQEKVCDTCRFNPPSSFDGKPCSQCSDDYSCWQRKEQGNER